jgi:hypothetical protein
LGVSPGAIISLGDVTAAARATAAASRKPLSRAFRPDTRRRAFARAAASCRLHAGRPGFGGISMGQQWGRRKHDEGNGTHRTRTIAQSRERTAAPITGPASRRSMSAIAPFTQQIDQVNDVVSVLPLRLGW